MKTLAWIVGLGFGGLLVFEMVKRWTAPKPERQDPLGTPAPGASAFENPPKYLGDPMRMATGQRYRMRYRSGSFDPKNMFEDVTKYSGSDILPKDWPLAAVVASDPTTLWAAGTWRGAGGPVPRPYGLWQIWPTASKA